MTKSISKWITLLLLSITIMFIIRQNLIQEENNDNPVINPPVATDSILQEVSTIPVQDVFDPPYEYTRNSGLIPHPNQNGYLMSFQTDIGASTRFYRTNLHIVALDQNYFATQHSEMHLLPSYTFHKHHWSGLSTAQDPRLFTVNDNIYMLYNDSVSSHYREVFIADISLDARGIYANNIRKVQYREGDYTDQKNWSPFIHDGNIYFIYSTDPNIILSFDPKTSQAQTAFHNQESFREAWPLGTIRGGTPAIYVKELDAYLTFFHSSLPYRKREPKLTKIHQPLSRIYYMGAFIFESKPPFKILAYTPKPLSYPNQYKNIDVNYHIIFPCGLIEEDRTFLISAGVQDEKDVIFRVNKQELYSKLKYIKLENKK